MCAPCGGGQGARRFLSIDCFIVERKSGPPRIETGRPFYKKESVARILCKTWHNVELGLWNGKDRLRHRHCVQCEEGQDLASSHHIRPPITLERQLEPTLACDCGQHCCLRTDGVGSKARPNTQPVVLRHRFGKAIQLCKRLRADENYFTQPDDMYVFVAARVPELRGVRARSRPGDRPDSPFVHRSVKGNVAA